jgi:cell division protein FtsI (penicillin-binding protein 3)
MNVEKKGNELSASGKLIVLFLFIAVAFFLLILNLFSISTGDRDTPTVKTQKVDKAIRGSIISKDGFHLATSKKTFSLAVNSKYIDENKKELFVKLLSIYSEIPQETILEKIEARKGYVVLSKDIDSKTAKNLKELSQKLFSLKVFKPKADKKSNKIIYYGLSIDEIGESRVYQYKESLTPVVGYTKKYNIRGIKGVEKYYEKELKGAQDGIIYGQKDIHGNVIFNENSKVIRKIDGLNVHLNVPLKFQYTVDKILSREKERLSAKEIVASVMDSKSGKIIAISSSNRFDPDHIKQEEISWLNATVSEKSYEPGSVTKPMILAGILERNLANPYDLVRGYNGRYRIGRKVITDTHAEAWLSVEDIIVYSSNIGIAQLAMKLSGQEINDIYYKFGYSRITEVDLPYEKAGLLPNVRKLNHDIYKATTSYGYGLRATFIQTLKAYNAFNNNGRVINPRIAEYLTDQAGRKIKLPPQIEEQAISPTTAKKMQNILIKTVKKGTGRDADVEGLVIGGKTGTAHIAKNGKYVNEYISSFFGFANDDTHRYTIGVTVFEPRAKGEYFASQTAAPVFRAIVEEMIKLQYLVPKNK